MLRLLCSNPKIDQQVTAVWTHSKSQQFTPDMDIALPSDVKRQLKTFQVCCSCFASCCLPILAAAFSQVPSWRWQHSCYGIVGSIGGARGKLDSLSIGGKLSTGVDSASSSRDCVLLTPSVTVWRPTAGQPFRKGGASPDYCTGHPISFLSVSACARHIP